MNLHEFNLLSPNEQEVIVWDKGNFLATFDHGSSMCDVYKVYTFYVSLCYEIGSNEKATLESAPHPDELTYLINIGRKIENKS